MAELTLRLIKGAPLTNEELDANFANLNSELLGKQAALGYTPANKAGDTFTGAVLTSNAGGFTANSAAKLWTDSGRGRLDLWEGPAQTKSLRVFNANGYGVIGMVSAENLELWTSGVARVTINGTTGNVTATGSLTATSFSGSASGLTGLKTVNGNSIIGSGNIQIDGGVTSFNTRTGAVTLSSGDVTTALGFTPLSNATSYLPLAGGTLTGNVQVNNGTDSRLLLQVSGTVQGQFQANESTVRLSSNNTLPLTLSTSGVDRITLASSGLITFATSAFLGLGGTPSSSVRLRVYGSGTTSEVARIDGGTLESQLIINQSDDPSVNTNRAQLSLRKNNVVGATISIDGASANRGIVYYDAYSATGSHAFYVNSTDRFRINAVGAVSFSSSYGTAGQMLKSGGSAGVPTWGSLTSGEVTTALGFTPYNSTNPSGYITSSALSSYLPLSGGTLTGMLTGTTILATLENSNARLKFKAADADGGSFALLGLDWGGAAGTYKDFEVYDYVNGRPMIRVLGANRDVVTYGKVTLGTFPNSTTNSGEAWIGRASDRSAGTMTVQLGSGSDRVFEVVDSAWSTVILAAGMNTLTYKGSALLHAGNYSSYALPLSGGTLSGPLVISTGATNGNYNEGIRLTRAANSWAGITFGSTGASGAPTGGWFAATNPSAQFIISPDDSSNASGLTLNKNGDALWRNLVLLHSGNYNSYSPSRTGAGASGNWGINVTGSSASTLLLSTAGMYVWSASSLPTSYSLGIQCSFVQSGNGWQNYGSVMTMNTYSGGGGALQMFVPYSPSYGGTGLQVRFGNYDVSSGNAWTGWKTLLASDNFSSYALPLGGGTLSGALTVSGGSSSIIAQDNGGAGDWRGRIISRNSTYDRASFLGTYNGVTGVFAHNHALNAWADLYVNTSDGSGGGTVRMPASVLINGSQALHAGNYTGYSGIIRALGFPSASNDWNALGNTYVNSVIQVDPSNFASTTTGPTAASYTYGTLLNLSAQSSSQAQIFISHAGNDLIFRGGWNGASWQTWNKVLTNQNFSSYALPLSGGTLTGYLYAPKVIINANSDISWGGEYSGGKPTIAAYSSALYFYPTGNSSGQTLLLSNSSTTTSRELIVSTGGAQQLQLVSPSGTQSLWVRAGYTANGTGTPASSLYNVQFQSSGSSGGTFTFCTGNDVALSIAGGAINSFVALQQGGNQVLHAGNYSSYALPLSGGTVTGIAYFQTNNNAYCGSTSDAKLQAYSTGNNSAFLSFHKGGHYAVNMGLDADNVIRIGGWSASANRWQLDMSGNGTYAGNVTGYSDERLKKDWAPLAPDYVSRLALVKSGTYTRIDSGERQAGSSAQDWQKLLPEVVQTGADEAQTLALAYGNAALVSAIELAKDNVELRARIERLELLINKLIGD